MTDLASARAALGTAHRQTEADALAVLLPHAPDATTRAAAHARATALVREIRESGAPGLMEAFLAEYGLSTDEGIALMCLAEALLRVPDAETVDALIEDKIAPSAWGAHLGRSSSPLVNASTWALMLTGKVLGEDGSGVAGVLRGAVRRLGEPVIRAAVRRAMKEMGNQFVLGETIDAAVARGRTMEAKGYTYSYDMLGEAALTEADAQAYHRAYAGAIAALAEHCLQDDVRNNPGISVKLSALHPRYEELQRARVMAELVPRVAELARAARAAGLGFTVDAEEAERLELSLDVIEAVLRDPALAGWDGFGVVVQAYGLRAGAVIDWLDALAEAQGRRLMVRLVKGAYWDREIKRAQAEGLAGFPVYTTKAATDVSYLCCAGKLLARRGRLYPQFATHNAHSVAAILEMSRGMPSAAYEFQRLHGMGEALHDRVLRQEGGRCRIYAPVGAHRDLLAYLVRRLLENGANSSFVHQMIDASVPPERVAADPFDALDRARPNAAVVPPHALFAPERRNSAGIDLWHPAELAGVEAARAPFRDTTWQSRPSLVSGPERAPEPVRNPADPREIVGHVRRVSAQDAHAAVAEAVPWAAPVEDRRQVLDRAAELYEAHRGELFALLAREAGKTLPDAVAELREAVDFLRYYGARAGGEAHPPLGRVVCISPWNFPLAIFTGQIAAALATGNAVLAKPAEATPLIAARATALLHEAGVPRSALQLLPGTGPEVGAALVRDPRVDGVAFTGSIATAIAIDRAMADHLAPTAPLIAETGGINAMIVDSTALPEQAVRDIVVSAFRSAGQRCSALRLLYVQEDVADTILTMLRGAMEALVAGDPWDPQTDIGPVIDAPAAARIAAHIEAARAEGRVIGGGPVPQRRHGIAPTLIRVGGMADLTEEVFGPVLHVATFRADETGAVVDAINAAGYGLTFGMHSRIDDRIEEVTTRIRAGNLYVNRNQIGAIVGSQPFGGEGLSGTGPKAGGPHYLARFCRAPMGEARAQGGPPADPARVQALIEAARADETWQTVRDLPGPTGESNRLSLRPRGRVLCLGPGTEAARAQAEQVRNVGCGAVLVAACASGDLALDGVLDPDALTGLTGYDAVVWWGARGEAGALRRALAARSGARLPLLSEADLAPRCVLERHLCIDTTASGGNATLLAAVG